MRQVHVNYLAGTIPGMCSDTDMDVGTDYIILARPMTTTRDFFSANDRFPVADRAALVPFSYACGIQQTYPVGENKNSHKVVCVVVVLMDCN
jgi:hypothetical protein